jgi:hypothetical protein
MFVLPGVLMSSIQHLRKASCLQFGQELAFLWYRVNIIKASCEAGTMSKICSVGTWNITIAGRPKSEGFTQDITTKSATSTPPHHPLVPLAVSSSPLPSASLTVSSSTSKSLSIISAQFWISPTSFSFLVPPLSNFSHCALSFASAAVCFASSFSCLDIATLLAWRSAVRVRSSLSTDAPTEAREAVTAARASEVRRAASAEVGEDIVGMNNILVILALLRFSSDRC